MQGVTESGQLVFGTSFKNPHPALRIQMAHQAGCIQTGGASADNTDIHAIATSGTKSAAQREEHMHDRQKSLTISSRSPHCNGALSHGRKYKEGVQSAFLQPDCSQLRTNVCVACMVPTSGDIHALEKAVEPCLQGLIQSKKGLMLISVMGSWPTLGYAWWMDRAQSSTHPRLPAQPAVFQLICR